MNKGDLIDKVAQVEEITKKKAKEIIDLIFDEIKSALSSGDTIKLVGFGTFSVVEKKARTGRNPQTGKKIKIPARRAPKFAPGKELKDALL